MKKGLSMVMTTLLTILMVVLIVGAIFVWTKSSVFQVQSGADKDKMCSEVDFVSADFCYEVQNVPNINTGKTESKTRINFHVKNNGNVQIQSFSILLIDNAGNSIPISALVGSKIEVSGIQTVTSDFILNPGNIDKIKVSPEIVLNRQIFICSGNEKTLSWGELKAC
ncbi:Uncharacterised protein [uncultured archaeon]|nr:Uncharacterised protein [uncultured archaeon]